MWGGVKVLIHIIHYEYNVSRKYQEMLLSLSYSYSLLLLLLQHLHILQNMGQKPQPPGGGDNTAQLAWPPGGAGGGARWPNAS